MLQRTRTPWKSILTCVPLWATMISHAGQSWGFLTFITEVPTYMSSVLQFDIKKVSEVCKRRSCPARGLCSFVS